VNLAAFRKAYSLFVLAGALLSFALPVVADVPVPEFYGIYIVIDGKPLDVHDAIAEGRAQMVGGTSLGSVRVGVGRLSDVQAKPDTYFLLYGPDNAPAAAGVALFELAFGETIRQDQITHVVPVTANFWTGVRRIELRVGPVAGHSDLVRLVPSSPLKEGAYALSLAPFGGSVIDKSVVREEIGFVADFFIGVKPQPQQSGYRSPESHPPPITSGAPNVEAPPKSGWTPECVGMVGLAVASESEQKAFEKTEHKRSVVAISYGDIFRIPKEREKGHKAYNTGNYPQAAQIFQGILGRDQLDWDAHVMVAASEVALKNPSSALDHACLALQRLRTSMLYAIVSQALAQKGDEKASLVWLDAALAGGFQLDRKRLDELFPGIAGTREYGEVVEKYHLAPPV